MAAAAFFKGVVHFVKELGKALWTPENAKKVFDRAVEYVKGDSEGPQQQLPEVVPPREVLPNPEVIPPRREFSVILLEKIKSINVVAAGLCLSLLAMLDLMTRSYRVEDVVDQQEEEEEHHEQAEEEHHEEEAEAEHHEEEEEEHHHEEEAEAEHHEEEEEEHHHEQEVEEAEAEHHEEEAEAEHQEEEEHHHPGHVRRYLIAGAQVLIFAWGSGVPDWVASTFLTTH